MKRKAFIPGLMILLVLSLFSCGGGGGGGTGGGGADYITVSLTAQLAAGSPFDSDVAKHTATVKLVSNCGDTNIDPDTSEPFDIITFSPDDPNFTITSTRIAGLPAGVNFSDVRLDSVTLTYAPRAGSPAIPVQTYDLGTIIAPGTSATVPIRIASQAMKYTPPLSDLICLGVPGPYTYDVTVTFRGVEVLTDKARSFTTNFTINFNDYVD